MARLTSVLNSILSTITLLGPLAVCPEFDDALQEYILRSLELGKAVEALSSEEMALGIQDHIWRLLRKRQVITKYQVCGWNDSFDLRNTEEGEDPRLTKAEALRNLAPGWGMMSPKIGQATALRLVGHLSFARIAEIQGVSVAAATARYYRGVRVFQSLAVQGSINHY